MKLKIPKSLQHDVTLSFFWIGLFIIVFAGLTVWYMNGKLKQRTEELEWKVVELRYCKKNLDEVLKQFSSGRVILELEK